MPNDPNASVSSPSAPVWRNWSGKSGAPAGFRRREVLLHADEPRGYRSPRSLRPRKYAGSDRPSSGQRHLQPPLVVDDDRGAAPQTKAFLIDMSCYKDLGSAHDQRIVPGPGSNQVTVNTGVREDELDAFLTKNNLMLTTVTAGGFFSLGGMTAVDVHGGTMDAPIFAETVAAFTLLLAERKRNDDRRAVAQGRQLVALAVRQSVVGRARNLRPRSRSMSRAAPGRRRFRVAQSDSQLADKAAFVKTFGPLLKNHTRLETFFTPYATSFVPLSAKNFLTLVVGCRQRLADEDAERATLSRQCLCARRQTAASVRRALSRRGRQIRRRRGGASAI